jgi:hypothetical protein
MGSPPCAPVQVIKAPRAGTQKARPARRGVADTITGFILGRAIEGRFYFPKIRKGRARKRGMTAPLHPGLRFVSEEIGGLRA